MKPIDECHTRAAEIRSVFDKRSDWTVEILDAWLTNVCEERHLPTDPAPFTSVSLLTPDMAHDEDALTKDAAIMLTNLKTLGRELKLHSVPELRLLEQTADAFLLLNLVQLASA